MDLKFRRKIWIENIAISVANKKEVGQIMRVAEICQGEYEESVYGEKIWG